MLNLVKSKYTLGQLKKYPPIEGCNGQLYVGPSCMNAMCRIGTLLKPEHIQEPVEEPKENNIKSMGYDRAKRSPKITAAQSSNR